MGDCNHGHIQWKSLESVGGDDHQLKMEDKGDKGGEQGEWVIVTMAIYNGNH